MRIQHYKYSSKMILIENVCFSMKCIFKCQCVVIELLESGRCRNEPSETQERLQLRCEVLTIGAAVLVQIGYGGKSGFFRYILVCAVSSQKPEIRMDSLKICME